MAITLNAVKSAEVKLSAPNSNFSTGTTALSEDNSCLLIGFETPADLYKYTPISSITCYLWLQSVTGSAGTLDISGLTAAFDEKTVTYNSKPGGFRGASQTVFNTGVGSYQSNSMSGYDAKYTVQNGICVQGSGAQVQTSRGTNKPYITVEFSTYDPGFLISGLTPANNAFSSKSAPCTFAWAFKDRSYNRYESLTQAACEFRWRQPGADTYNTIQVGSNESITVPANTFSGESIEWQLFVTAANGTTETTSWYTLSLAEPASTAQIVAPKSAVLDGTIDNVFSWEHVISTGTAQTAFDLQTSPDSMTWTTLLSAATAETSAAIPANTLTGGDLYWRVRTYNTDSVAGEWSDIAHCVVVAAPAAPLVSIVDTAPRFSVRWQQAGQQGYEIMLDGEIIAKRFGETSSYQYDGYLAPGSYTVQVRIQNKYGLWSEWGSAALPVSNVEGAEIALSAAADNVVTLQWSTVEAYDAYLIYRDGLLIGRTQDTSFTDNFALGDVSYQVRGIYDDTGYYTLSNAAAVSVRVSALMISPVKSPAWQRLPLSTSSLRSRTHGATQAVNYLHYTGSALPSAEIGEALDKTYRFDAAFIRTNRAAAAAFESLIGQLVCIKDPDGYRIVGVLGTYSMTATPFYTSYSCTVTLVNWQEGVDL